MNTFSDVPGVSRDDASRAFSSGDAEAICRALVAITFHDSDVQWVQQTCIGFLSNGESRVRGLAATCLGHLARIHRNIDREMVLGALRQHLADDEIAGRVGDAMDDIDMFA